MANRTTRTFPVGQTPVEICPPNAQRTASVIYNDGSAAPDNILTGDDDQVGPNTPHFPVVPGQSIVYENEPGAIWAVAVSGTQTVRCIETDIGPSTG